MVGAQTNPYLYNTVTNPATDAEDDEVFENEAKDDPNLKRQAGRVEDRLDKFGKYTQQSIDMAVSDIRDQTEGRRAALQGMLARKGIGGTGFEGVIERGLAGDEARAAAAATSGMRVERDRDYDALLLGSTGALGAPGAANRADRSLALTAWTEANANRRANEVLEMQKIQQQVDLIEDLTTGSLSNSNLGGMSGMMRSSSVVGGGGWGSFAGGK